MSDEDRFLRLMQWALATLALCALSGPISPAPSAAWRYVAYQGAVVMVVNMVNRGSDWSFAT